MLVCFSEVVRFSEGPLWEVPLKSFCPSVCPCPNSLVISLFLHSLPNAVGENLWIFSHLELYWVWERARVLLCGREPESCILRCMCRGFYTSLHSYTYITWFSTNVCSLMSLLDQDGKHSQTLWKNELTYRPLATPTSLHMLMIRPPLTCGFLVPRRSKQPHLSQVTLLHVICMYIHEVFKRRDSQSNTTQYKYNSPKTVEKWAGNVKALSHYITSDCLLLLLTAFAYVNWSYAASISRLMSCAVTPRPRKDWLSLC